MRLKTGVEFTLLTPQLLMGLLIANDVYRRAGWDLRITSITDGEHAGNPVQGDTQDPHYLGKAADLGIKEIPREQWEPLKEALEFALGPQFVVLLETGKSPHIHLQFGHVA